MLIRIVLAFRPLPMSPIPSRCLSTTARRNATTDKGLENPIIEDYLKKKSEEENQQGRKDEPIRMREGHLSTSPSSAFFPEREIPGWRPDMSLKERERLLERAALEKEMAERREKRRMTTMNLDPDPRARRKVERKLIISGVKRRGRLTKAQIIARTERQSLFKSKFLPTSVKKLQKVVNQIAGKTVSDALVQLRFSKKKVARDVMKGLEIAQNEAILARGMGLGQSKSSMEQWQAQRTDTDAGRSKDSWNYRTLPEDPNSIKDGKPISPEEQKARAATIELKNGTKKVVKDPTEIYIDQAWVGAGQHTKEPSFRARGKVDTLRHRTTSTFFPPRLEILSTRECKG